MLPARKWLLTLIGSVILTTQPALTEPPKTQVLKKDQTFIVPYDGYFMPDERGRNLAVMGKDFEVCKKQRDDLRNELNDCLASKEQQWWETTYFKITLGLILGYTGAKLLED